MVSLAGEETQGRWGHSFTRGWPDFPASLVKEIVFNPLYILASFVEDKVSICAWIYLWAFYFVPLIYISVFVPVPYCLDDCGFVVEPEVRQVDSSPTLSDPVDYSPPGSPWDSLGKNTGLSMGFSTQEYWSRLPSPSPGESSQPRDRTQVSCIAGGFFTN